MAPGAGSGGGDDSPSLDVVLEILSQYQRREIVRALRDNPEEVVSLDAVIERLGALEEQRTGERPGSDHLLSVLVHIHGPRLEEAGLVEYDVRSRELRYYADDRVEEILAKIDEVTGGK